jgi:hypothetical protein
MDATRQQVFLKSLHFAAIFPGVQLLAVTLKKFLGDTIGMMCDTMPSPASESITSGTKTLKPLIASSEA